MESVISDKAVNRLEDRLQGLKKQNLRIKTTLLHTVETGEKIPDTPERLLIEKNVGRCFSGITGWRSDVQMPTKQTVYFAGGETEERDVLSFATANNFIACDSQSTPNNYEEREPIENDFWSIADELGKVVWSLLPTLRKLGLWEMWQRIEPCSNHDMSGVWVDFVFELAWSSHSQLVDAKKMVFWNGVTIELNSVRKVTPSFAGFTLADGTKPLLDVSSQIPNPVPQWHSKIKDIVAASQHALDFLRETKPKATQPKKTTKPATKKGKAGRKSQGNQDSPTFVIWKAALLAHHKYASEELFLEPLTPTAIENLGGCSKSSASRHFKDRFQGGFPEYVRICSDRKRLETELGLLAGDYSVQRLHSLVGELQESNATHLNER